ncbi:hypothetical protein [Kitasatospora azatica]|uniref:hypothetical protein n=1 Tax=Kitasatospora azatica TaxID=58347 RepID=UPI0012F9FAA2|nr:hypothetical protein [Kitasatospora azatica]
MIHNDVARVRALPARTLEPRSSAPRGSEPRSSECRSLEPRSLAPRSLEPRGVEPRALVRPLSCDWTDLPADPAPRALVRDFDIRPLVRSTEGGR